MRSGLVGHAEEIRGSRRPRAAGIALTASARRASRVGYGGGAVVRETEPAWYRVWDDVFSRRCRAFGERVGGSKGPKTTRIFGCGGGSHPWAESAPSRRQSRLLLQQSHPTRVVARVGIHWRTSAHKGSPLFRRRAPVPNTVDPKGLLALRGQAVAWQSARRPFVGDEDCR